MPTHAFTPIRDDTVFAIYAISVALPITVQWPSCRQTLAIVTYSYPPHCGLEFFPSADCAEAGLVYELESIEHGRQIVSQGFKVPAPSALDAFCARLVRENRAHLIAGSHCEVPWTSHMELQLGANPRALELDPFWR